MGFREFAETLLRTCGHDNKQRAPAVPAKEAKASQTCTGSQFVICVHHCRQFVAQGSFVCCLQTQ